VEHVNVVEFAAVAVGGVVFCVTLTVPVVLQPLFEDVTV
jgi:hypothetical protein